MEKRLQELLEDQANKELWSAYLYLDIAEFYRAKGFDGLHSWFEHQAQEEIEHAEKFMEFLHDSDVPFRLKPIDAPVEKFDDLKAPLLFQLKHEKLVTSLIMNIYEEALKEHDHMVTRFLDWFIDEQFEEEKHSKELIDRYELLCDSGLGLAKFDKELKERK